MKRDRSVKYRISCALCACAALVLATSTARAYISASGNACEGAFSSGNAFHDDIGAENDNAASTVSFMCPLSWGTTSGTTATVSTGQLVYIDHSSTNPFYCYVTRTAYWGSQFWSASKYTCSGSGGGCVDPTSSYTGVNTLIWSSAELGSNITTHYYNDGISFRCDVPKANSHVNSGRSGVISYALY